MMDRIVELYRSAFEGLRYDPKGYFEKDFPLLDDKLINGLFFGGLALYTLMLSLAIGAFLGGVAGIFSAFFSAIFAPIPAAIIVAAFSGYTLLFCNMLFGQPTNFKMVWKFAVGIGALLMPVAIISSIMSIIPVVGLLASLAYTVVAVVTAYWGFRYFLKLSLSQILILHAPIFVVGLVSMMISFMVGATLFVASNQYDTELQKSRDHLERLNQEVANLDRLSRYDQSAKSVKKIAKKKDKPAKKLLPKTFRSGERYVYTISRGKKNKMAKGKVTISFRTKNTELLEAKVLTKVGKYRESATVALPKEATPYDLFKEITMVLEKKKNSKIDGYNTLITNFLAAHTGASSHEKTEYESMRKVSGDLGLIGAAFADNNPATPKIQGKVSIAGREGRKYRHNSGKSTSTVVTDQKLPLPVIAMTIKEPQGVLKIKLQKYKGKL